MTFTNPLWEQARSGSTSPEEIAADAARVERIVALLPLESVTATVRSQVDSVREAALEAALGLPLLAEAADESVKNHLLEERKELEANLRNPDFDALARLVREQVVREWINTVWLGVNESDPIRLGGALLPEVPSNVSNWSTALLARRAELLSYLPINKSGLVVLTRLFVGEVQKLMQREPLSLPLGITVETLPNQEVIAHRKPLSGSFKAINWKDSGATPHGS